MHQLFKATRSLKPGRAELVLWHAAIVLAARHPEVVRRLLAGGAPVVAANRAGDHPIHAAAWGGDVRALALLIASGAAAVM